MRTSKCRLGLTLVLAWTGFWLNSSVAAAQEKTLHWPQFRGPGGQGISQSKDVPVKWSQNENLLWKKELPGAGASAPVIVGDRIYLTCYSGYGVPGQPKGDMEQLKLHVLCLSREGGKIIWNKTIKPKLPEQETIREDHGYASSTIAADSERLFVFLGKTGVFAFDHDGNQQWQADVGSGLNGWGTAASPILFQNLVIVNASVESKSLVALDRKNGKEVWRAGGIEESWNTPILVKGMNTELVVAIMGKVLSFDPTSGKSLWSCKTDIPWYMVPSLVTHEDIVYCVGGRNNGGALAVRIGGKGDVTQTHRLWAGKKGTNVPSPIYHDGHLYWMHEGLGVAYCADAKTGKLVYEERIPGAGQVYASPVMAGGKIYYLARTGQTYVLPAQPRYELLQVNNLKSRETFNAALAVAEGNLFIRSDSTLYCIGKGN